MVADDKLPKGAVKLLLNLALIAGDALVRGGRLDVGAERQDGGARNGRSAPKGRASCSTPSFARRLLRGSSDGDGRAARGGRLAGPQPGGGSRRLDPAFRPGRRGADDRRRPCRCATGLTRR